MMQVHIAWIWIVGAACLILGMFAAEANEHQRREGKQNERRKPARRGFDNQHGG